MVFYLCINVFIIKWIIIPSGKSIFIEFFFNQMSICNLCTLDLTQSIIRGAHMHSKVMEPVSMLWMTLWELHQSFIKYTVQMDHRYCRQFLIDEKIYFPRISFFRIFFKLFSCEVHFGFGEQPETKAVDIDVIFNTIHVPRYISSVYKRQRIGNDILWLEYNKSKNVKRPNRNNIKNQKCF